MLGTNKTLPMPNPETASSPAIPIRVSEINVAPRHLLVPIDFSAESPTTVAYAAKIAKTAGARITLLHVVEIPRTEINPGLFAAMGQIQTRLKALREDAQRSLTAFANEVRALGVECTEEIRAGIPYGEILNVAEQTAPDLIVVGHKGASALARFLLGSTAERVVRHAPCSVLTVRA